VRTGLVLVDLYCEVATRHLAPLMGVHRLEDRIQQAVAEPPVGQHYAPQGLEP
jgi:hypothetical protein